VAVISLAKRIEEVFVPGRREALVLGHDTPELQLLQRVRDEAHRFAITYHRQKRSARMTSSALDGVPGLGETRRTALLKHFGSVRKLRTATVEAITEVPGVGRRTAEAVLAALNDDDGAGADRQPSTATSQAATSQAATSQAATSQAATSQGEAS
jgi:excinuclease ABC subunit C